MNHFKSPPRPLARLGNDKFLLLLVGLALLGGLLILLREINYGAVVSWDSVTYMSTAENTAAGRWFITFYYGKPLINWPPMYPLLMAPIVLLGFDVHGSAGFVNAAAFTLTVLFSALWLRRHLDSRLIVVWGTLAVMVSIPLTNLAASALSEPTFILFALLALIQTEKFLSGGSRSSLTWAAVFTALACLTRYMGVAVLAAVVLLLLFQRNTAPREKAVRIAVYSLISAAPVCLWLLRNVLITGRPTSIADWEPTTPLLSNLRLALETLVAWVFPVARMPNGVEDLAAPLVLIALLLMAGAAAHVLLRTRGEAAGIGLGPLVPIGVFVLVYAVLLIASGFFVDIGSGNFSRYLSPIYAPLVFIVALTADRLSKRARLETLIGSGGWPAIRTLVRGGGQTRSTLGVILLVGLFLALAHPIDLSRWYAQRHIDRGLSYESEKWVDSELMQSLKTQLDLDPGAVFYTNQQPAVWLYHRVTANGLTDQWHMDDLKQAASTNEDDIYIAYFYANHGRPSLMPQIESLDVESALEVEDGILYRCCGTGPETDN